MHKGRHKTTTGAWLKDQTPVKNYDCFKTIPILRPRPYSPMVIMYSLMKLEPGSNWFIK
jgi:hypothetical protein